MKKNDNEYLKMIEVFDSFMDENYNRTDIDITTDFFIDWLNDYINDSNQETD